MDKAYKTPKSFRRFGAGIAPLILAAAANSAAADSLSFGAQATLEARYFAEAGAFSGQNDDTQLSFTFQPDIGWDSDDGKHQIRFAGFYRYDSLDDARTHADIREANYRYSNADWDILVGVNRVFWGVTESRHLVNIINQIDAVEDIDEEDFLGQPMLQIGRQTELGRFDLYLMPGFRERQFPSLAGRLRTGLPVDESAATFESSKGTHAPEAALRYSHYIGDLDIGLHVFHGSSREPTLTVNGGGTALEPFYPTITQVGVDLQYTTDAWLWKLEGIVRKGQGKTFGAAVAGAEYTLYQVGGSGMDLGLIAEALYDGRDDTVYPTIYDRDVFVGARLALNDEADTSVLAGLLTDVDDGPQALRIEAERRLGENWAVELVGQAFLEDDPANTAQNFEHDSFFTLRLKHFF